MYVDNIIIHDMDSLAHYVWKSVLLCCHHLRLQKKI